jgi:release factor glutamine methyltransferase
MTNISEILIVSTKKLQLAGIAKAAMEARILVAFALAMDKEELLRNNDKILSYKQIENINKLVAMRVTHKPIAHITGTKEFYGRNFKVSPDTLIPRPDSETLIDVFIETFPDKNISLNILDLGTGSGCLLLTILAEYLNCSGVGIDANKNAINIAKDNSCNLGLAKRVNLLLNDWGSGIENEFDVIISNPPYITKQDIDNLDSEVKDFEPHMALFGGDDGLEFYRKTALFAKSNLINNGIIILECGKGQHLDIITIMQSYGFKLVLCKKDLSEIDRIIVFSNK